MPEVPEEFVLLADVKVQASQLTVVSIGADFVTGTVVQAAIGIACHIWHRPIFQIRLGDGAQHQRRRNHVAREWRARNVAIGQDAAERIEDLVVVDAICDLSRG